MATQMSAGTTYARSTLPEEMRQPAAEALQSELSELLDMTLKSKQAHWNLTGPNFRPVHLQLDDITADLRDWSDRVGERIVTLGLPAYGQADAIAGSNLQPLKPGVIRDTEVITIMSDLLTECTSRARGRAKDMGEIDLVSQNIFLDIIEGMEKHLWMLQAQEPG